MFQSARFLCLLCAAALFVTSTARTKAQFPPPPPISVVRQQDGWTLYSRKVNIPVCAAQPTDHSGETWVGTALGIKRLAKDGTLLRLFTRNDGLPSDVVSALAVEPKEAWAIAPLGLGHYDLCRLDRKSEKWETLREITVTLPNVSDWTGFPNFIATGSSRYVCFTVGNSAFNGPWPLVYLFDRQNHTWRDASWKDAPRHFAANWLYARTDSDSANSVFIATDSGLVRYQVEQNEWQTCLPERAVVGGTPAKDGSLWLATLTASTKRLPPSDVQLHLTCFDPQRQEIVSDSIFQQSAQKSGSRPGQFPSGNQPELEFPGPRRNVVEADNSVWLATQHQNGIFVTIPTLPETVMRFDEQTHVWSEPKLDDSADIPAAVTATAQLSDYRIPNALMSRSLPGWISPAADFPKEVTTAFAPSPAWKVEKNSFTYSRASNTPAETVTLPSQRVPMTPGISAVKVVDQTVYALSGGTLWSKNEHESKWSEHPLPTLETMHYSTRHEYLFSYDKDLWACTDGSLWAFNPKTESWGKHLSFDWQKNIVGVDNGSVWLASEYGAGLTRLPLSGGNAETVLVEPVPYPSPRQKMAAEEYKSRQAEMGFGSFSSPVTQRVYAGTPLRVCLGSAWYASTSVASSETTTTLRGYDLKTHVWTEPLDIAGKLAGLTVYSTEHDLYLSFGSRILHTQAPEHPAASGGAVYRFRGDIRHWESVAPAIEREKQSMGASRIISVDAQAIWLADNGHGLWRWDRSLRTWAFYPSKKVFFESGSFNDNEPRDAGALQGDCIYLTSTHGLMRFSRSTQRWATLPFQENASDFKVGDFTGDPRAVWAICEDYAGGSCVARYDLNTRKWMFFTPPQSQSSVDHFLRIVSDGDTGTLLEEPLVGSLYNLDPHTGRWRDLKPALLKSVAPGKDHVYAHTERLVADGADIWALVTIRSSILPATIQASTVLARWNTSRGLTVYTVPEETAQEQTFNFWSGNILVQPETVSLLLSGGVERFLKADKSLQSLVPPAGFPTPRGAHIDSMTSAPDGSLWLIGRDTVMHWAQSSAAETRHTP